MSLKKLVGPGSIVTAAFIGPGTLTVCTLAGVRFGYDLLWVLVFAIVATIILQEMAARLGLIYGGLGQAIRNEIANKWSRLGATVLVFLAIIFGNAAYEAGNITGASLGAEALISPTIPWPVVLGLVVTVLLWIGSYKILQMLLTLAVVIMSIVFVTTAVLVPHDIAALLGGFKPVITTENQWMVMALMGTTIVPYNLFLHASMVRKKWTDAAELPLARRESAMAIMIGGVISFGIILTATGVSGQAINNVADMAEQLTPILGSFAKPFLAAGLLAAGITSALTAPLAAMITASGLFGWAPTDWKSRAVWMTVILCGVTFSSLSIQPIRLIQVAQTANGILLPLIVLFLLIMCNKSAIMGTHANTRWQNLAGIFVWLIATLAGFRALNSVFAWW